MSRVDENEELLDRAKLSFTGNPERVMCDIEAQKLGILMDISKSLAILADCFLVEQQEKSCKDCIYWLMNKDDENRRCRYCNDMDEFSPLEGDDGK